MKDLGPHWWLTAQWQSSRLSVGGPPRLLALRTGNSAASLFYAPVQGLQEIVTPLEIGLPLLTLHVPKPRAILDSARAIRAVEGMGTVGAAYKLRPGAGSTFMPYNRARAVVLLTRNCNSQDLTSTYRLKQLLRVAQNLGAGSAPLC